jgi:hypothetical protein
MGVTSKRVPDVGKHGGRGQIVMGWELSTCERASQADAVSELHATKRSAILAAE